MMTKEEFNTEFMSDDCVVRADTMDEWREINRYCVEQLGLRQSEMYETHDCGGYPYVYRRSINFVGAMARPIGCNIVPFGDFLVITQQDEEDIMCGSLEEVL